ncbi:MAG TPA: AMIN domain-containing protein [Firmicutes bacterium]|nr:AMIN domain-containing protein [Bacillota bacterium]
MSRYFLAFVICFALLALIFSGCLPSSRALAVSGECEHLLPGGGLSMVTGVRFETYPEKVRIVFDLTSSTTYRVSQMHNPPRIVIEIDNAHVHEPCTGEPCVGEPPQVLSVDDVAVRAIRISQVGGDRVRGVVDLRYALPRCQVFTLEDPDRIVVDVPKQYMEQRRLTIASGVKYVQIDKGTSLGPVMIDMLDVDLNNPKISVRTALAQESGFGRAPVSAIVAREGAIAGVNGVYFDSTGRPLGLIILNGQIVTEPVLGRTALGITRDNKVFMDNVDFNATVTVIPASTSTPGVAESGSEGQDAATTFAIDGINRRRGEDEVILYTPFFGATTGTNNYGVEVAVAGGRVVETGNSNLAIPREGYVLSAHGKAKKFLTGLKPGDQIDIRLGLTNDWMEKGVIYAVGGGPRLVANGQVSITSTKERFGPDIALSRAPRTAVGITGDGHLLLVTVSGRRPDISIGMTLDELAEFMVQQGAVDAMNFDGGGSSTMVIRGYVINLPSDGVERKVSDAILVFVEESGLFDRAIQ